MNFISLIVWFAAQAWWLVFIRCSVNQQVPMLQGYRKYVPESDSSEDGFHRWGAIKSAWVGLLCLAVVIFFCKWYAVMFFPILVAEYWNYFDQWLNKGLKNPDGYLGNESWWDQHLKKWFGQDAGKKKRLIADLVSAACDLAFIIIFLLKSK
jgi:hypothetical protein